MPCITVVMLHVVLLNATGFWFSFNMENRGSWILGCILGLNFCYFLFLVLLSLPMLKEIWGVNTFKYVKIYQLLYAYSILYEAFQLTNQQIRSLNLLMNSFPGLFNILVSGFAVRLLVTLCKRIMLIYCRMFGFWKQTPLVVIFLKFCLFVVKNLQDFLWIIIWESVHLKIFKILSEDSYFCETTYTVLVLSNSFINTVFE